MRGSGQEDKESQDLVEGHSSDEIRACDTLAFIDSHLPFLPKSTTAFLQAGWFSGWHDISSRQMSSSRNVMLSIE